VGFAARGALRGFLVGALLAAFRTRFRASGRCTAQVLIWCAMSIASSFVFSSKRSTIITASPSLRVSVTLASFGVLNMLALLWFVLNDSVTHAVEIEAALAIVVLALAQARQDRRQHRIARVLQILRVLGRVGSEQHVRSKQP
jgi:hypothetical protein